MRALRKELLTPEEYLDGERASDVKHEYVAGIVYAMAGAKNRHDEIALNVLASLHAQLRGKPCRPYNSDTKVRVQLRNEVRFYYPDAQVTCRPNAGAETFQDYPTVIVEVLSESTRRVDEGEKRDAYLSIPSLSVYLLVETDEARVTAYRRTDTGFLRESFEELSTVVALSAIGAELRLAEVYEGIDVTDAGS